MFKYKKVNLIILVLGLSFLFSGCASKNAMSIIETIGNSSVQSSTIESHEEIAFDKDIIQDKEEMSNENIQFNTTSTLNRKIIKKGTINLQTKTFGESVQSVIDEVNVIGGFIQECSIEGNNLYHTYERRLAHLSVRIPNTLFDTFMNDSGQFGNVTYKNIQGEDITDQYIDIEIRLSTLEIQAERLKELLQQAGDLEELFKIEKELGNVTYEIESLKGTLKKYDSLIDYSTVDLYIEEAQSYIESVKEKTFIDRIQNTFIQSFEEVIDLFENLCLMLVALVPFLIIFIPVIVIGIKLIAYTRKKKQQLVDEKTKRKDE